MAVNAQDAPYGHDVRMVATEIPKTDSNGVATPSRRREGTFPTLLATYRERHGYSQAHLAYLVGVSHGHISKLEADKRNPSLAMIARIAAALTLSERDTLRLCLAAGRWPYHGEVSDEAIDQILEAMGE